MTTAAVRFVEFRTGIDVFLGVAVLLRKNRSRKKKASGYQDKSSCWHG
jgi:hypothetical protein